MNVYLNTLVDLKSVVYTLFNNHSNEIQPELILYIDIYYNFYISSHITFFLQTCYQV